MERPVYSAPLQSTGGAVPVKNEKGEISMQKVKVQRYVAGKRPKYAPSSDNEEDYERSSENSESDEETAKASTSKARFNPQSTVNNADDRRLKRLNEIDKNETASNTRERLNRHRQVAEPVILQEESMDEDSRHSVENEKQNDNEEEEDDEIDEEERMRKRLELKKRALQQRQEELLSSAGKDQINSDKESDSDGDDESDSDDESETDEEYSDSEDELAPRLKPVFIRKSDRVTIKEKEIQAEKEKQVEKERERLRVEAKKQTKLYIAAEIAKEKLSEKETDENILCDFNTDDENNEVDYNAWKLRELRRIKRDRDEKEAMEKEKQEIQRIRNMTEEERLAYLKTNPKIITNEKKQQGKYKFLQKYYHRGAFFMDEENEVFKRNFAEPTLEDHFDKTILPKVMQVKNFGMSGRTKYTHLLDQDTTRLDDNPWVDQEKFINGKGGGTKQVFDKPKAKK